MPYIQEASRIQYEAALASLPHIATPGDLNYLLTMIVLRYLKAHGSRYQVINDIVGAFEGAKLEFYRRFAGPYEDTKIISNGDVYPKQGG